MFFVCFHFISFLILQFNVLVSLERLLLFILSYIYSFSYSFLFRVRKNVPSTLFAWMRKKNTREELNWNYFSCRSRPNDSIRLKSLIRVFFFVVVATAAVVFILEAFYKRIFLSLSWNLIKTFDIFLPATFYRSNQISSVGWISSMFFLVLSFHYIVFPQDFLVS